MSSSDQKNITRRRLLVTGSAPLILAACGFTPIYGEGSAASAMAGKIVIGPLDGRTGFDLRERLESRLGPPVDPRFQLDVSLSFSTRGLAITQDGSITRYNLRGSAGFTVSHINGAEVFSDTVIANTAYNATGSAYATRVAAQDANRRLVVTLADKIVTRMAVTARNWMS